jgi:hypothetical protein
VASGDDRGLKPAFVVGLYSALEAPLFHVTAGIHDFFS